MNRLKVLLLIDRILVLIIRSVLFTLLYAFFFYQNSYSCFDSYIDLSIFFMHDDV